MSARGISYDAHRAIFKMATPASGCDIPGDWSANAIIGMFGSDAVDELLSAGFIQRGGSPAKVPEAIAARYFSEMEHWQRWHDKARKDPINWKPVYPAPDRFLLMTDAGWSWVMNNPPPRNAE